MSAFLARRWKQQPQGVLTVDLGHPLAAGLAVALTPRAFNIFDSNQTPITPVSVRNGPALAYTKQSDAVPTIFTLPKAISSSNWTLLQEVSCTPDPANYSATGGIHSSASERIHLHFKAYPSGNFGADARPYITDWNTTSGLPTSGRVILGATISSPATTISGYVNGSPTVFRTDITPSTINVNQVELFRKIYGGGGPDSMANGSTSSFFFVWTRPLSSSEMYAVSENPWQIFRPKKTVLYSLPGNLFSALDEATSDRADYIKSTAAGQVYETTLSPIQQTTGNINFVFDAGSPLNTGGIKFDVLDGTNLVKSQTVTFPSATSHFTITPSEYSSIGPSMFGRFMPQRWKQQPQGNVQIDWNNPLTNGLFLAAAPGISAQYFCRIPTDNPNFVSANVGSVLRYQSTVRRPTTFGTGFTGTTVYVNSSNVNASYLLKDISLGGSPVYTYGFVYCQMDTPDAAVSGFSYSNSQSTFSYHATNTYAQFIARNWTSQIDTTANDHFVAAPSGVPSQKQLTATVTWVTGQPGRMYNGKNLLVSSNTTVWDGGYELYGNLFLTAYGTGKTAGLLGVTWLRALTDNDRAAFDENPWQIFRPNAGRIYGIPPASVTFPWSPKLRVTSL